MLKTGTLLGDLGDELKQAVKDSAKTVKQQVVGFEYKESTSSSEVGQQPPVKTEDNTALLEALYGKSKSSEGSNSSESRKRGGSDDSLQNELAGKTPEEQQEIIKKRQELGQMHSASYYQPLIQKIEQERKTPEDTERASERVERLEMEDLQEKQKKKEKEEPIAVTRGKNSLEANRGASG
ncbi:MAG: hypothetical protein AAB907_02665 [Patescibacteria group bacterium]